MTTSPSLAPSAPVRAGERPHAHLDAFRSALAPHPAWFAVDERLAAGIASTPLAGRMQVHRLGPAAAAVVSDLSPADTALLAPLAPHVFINDPGAITEHFPAGGIALALARAGCQVHARDDAEARLDAGIARHGVLTPLEFVLSGRERLDLLPRVTRAATQSQRRSETRRRRAVFILDMIQDFEILRPLLARAAAPGSPFEPRVAVSDRLAKSHLWETVKLFLAVVDIPHFVPLGPVDIANALGSERALLVTAAESSAKPHAYGHTAFRSAPPRTLRVSVQHGLECIGLRHHRAHDIDFPNGVRFASDVVLTWLPLHALSNVHPAELHKCIPVGVVKATAERAMALLERRWEGARPRATGRDAAARLLVAENLHSVRFRTPARYQRFLSFIENAVATPGLDVTIRSHPASRTLERRQDANKFKFLPGLLRADDFAAFDAFVSPPSTVVLDAVMAGVPAAVWTDAAMHGDAANYAGLPVVTDIGQLVALTAPRDAAGALRPLEWAVGATSALNGAPTAWSAICQLMT